MARQRKMTKRHNYTKGGRVRLHPGGRAGYAHSHPHSDVNDTETNEYDETVWNPGGQGSGMYADLTADTSKKYRTEVEDALEGKVSPYAKHIAAKASSYCTCKRNCINWNCC